MLTSDLEGENKWNIPFDISVVSFEGSYEDTRRLNAIAKRIEDPNDNVVVIIADWTSFFDEQGSFMNKVLRHLSPLTKGLNSKYATLKIVDRPSRSRYGYKRVVKNYLNYAEPTPRTISLIKGSRNLYSGQFVVILDYSIDHGNYAPVLDSMFDEQQKHEIIENYSYVDIEATNAFNTPEEFRNWIMS